MSDVTSGDSNYSSSEVSDFSDEASSHSSSYDIDSDVPLAVYAKRPRQSAAAPLRWRDEDSAPLKYGFSGDGGAIGEGLNRLSTCSETFAVFFNDELNTRIVEETNRYAVQRPASSSSHMR